MLLPTDTENKKFHAVCLNSMYPIEMEVTASYVIVLRGIFDNQQFSLDVIVGNEAGDMGGGLRAELEARLAKRVNSGVDPILKYGLHICNEQWTRDRNYNEIVHEMKQYLLPETLQAIPYDSHCLRDRMMFLGEPYPSEYLPFLSQFKLANKSVIASLVLALPYNVTAPMFQWLAEANGLLRDAVHDRAYMAGIGTQLYAYPDWTNVSDVVLETILEAAAEQINLGFDGILIQANWLQDDQRNVEKAPLTSLFSYLPQDLRHRMRDLLPWNVRTANAENGQLIRNYNYFGGESVSRVVDYLRHRQVRPLLVLAESTTSPNANVVYRQTRATWAALREILGRILANSLNGIGSANVNVCGDDGNGNDSVNFELCVRWYQLASMTALYRVESRQSPIYLSKYGQRLVARVTRRRYSLASYFATTEARYPGRPLNVPVFYDWSTTADGMVVSSSSSSSIGSSDNRMMMMVGDALIVVPVVEPLVQEVEVRLPGLCYEFSDGLSVPGNVTTELGIVLDDLPLFIRAGHIVPVHESHVCLTRIARI